ncbi:MAG: hypothetical protein IJ997_03075 [Mycoplasmataceae bacterium]|nr:hypothetical protein [Mycoplasmataceae bacterium]
MINLLDLKKIVEKTTISGRNFPFEESRIYKLYQYSNIDIKNFLLPINNQKATLKLNRLDKCNDGQEVNKINMQFDSNAKKFYISCFTKESNENIHMWYMYGRLPHSKKCRYSFNQKALYNLINSSDLKIYYFENGISKYLDIKDFEIKMVKIAYCGMSNEFDDSGFEDKIVISNEKYNCKFEDLINNPEKSLLAGRIKNIAWYNEDEFRIILTLKQVNLNIEEFYIELSDNVVNREIILSPWWTSYYEENNNMFIKNSLFKDQVNNIFPKSSCSNCGS